MGMNQNDRYDIIVVGSGVAGLFSALQLPADKKILVISKASLAESDSYLAQGGICVLKNDDDYDSFYEDTMRAGHYENDRAAVHLMIQRSQEIIEDLLSFGVQFETEHGSFAYTKEGAHSVPRILYHQDVTGKEITSKLLAAARKRSNIQLIDYTEMLDLLAIGNVVTGIVARDRSGQIRFLTSDYVILATGGIGGLFENSTNYSHLTGDAVALALQHHIDVANLDYIQIHPTALYSEKSGRRFLISESMRGEGGILLNQRKERFVDELMPRDYVADAILTQMKQDGSKHVWLSVQDMGEETIKKRFPNIYHQCLEEGYDITKDSIPVIPAQHYFMGGVKVDLNSATSMEHLYAVGETSCNGVHGANRLASNSLLESLVFAKGAAKHIADRYQSLSSPIHYPDPSQYQDLQQLHQERKTRILDEIERSKTIERPDYNHTQCG